MSSQKTPTTTTQMKQSIEKWDINPDNVEQMALRDIAAKRVLREARETVMLASQFFGTLIYHMPCEIWDKSRWIAGVPCTAFTDGRKIVWNPVFLLGLTREELCVVFCHEIMHPALQHIGRLAGRDHTLWNIACDYAINLLIFDFVENAKKTMKSFGHNWEVHPSLLLNEKYRGMSAEQIYGKLIEENDKEPKKIITFDDESECGGGKQGEECGVDTPKMIEDLVRGVTQMIRGENTTPQDEKELAKQWREYFTQAIQVAKTMGSTPSGMEILLNELYKPVVDWRTIVMQYVSVASKNDYTWNRPNTRLIGQGIYSPSLYSRSVGDIVCILDDSGSMYNEIPHCVSEIVGIFHTCYTSILHFVCCDTEAHHVCDWSFGGEEPKIVGSNAEKIIGGGGTSFIEPFKMIRNKGWNPVLVLYFTDLDGTLPTLDLDPMCPVLWICINTYHEQNELPFGKLCEMTEIVTEERK